MFTGIVEEVGRVRSSERGTLVIEYSTLEDIALGDSIAVNGCDLTVTALDGGAMTFNCMPETYRRTNLGELKSGDPVNLERSVTPTTRLSGHIVRGVIEATGRVHSFTPEEDAVLARFEAPEDILRHTIVKGPITIDGVSLTVVGKDAGHLHGGKPDYGGSSHYAYHAGVITRAGCAGGGRGGSGNAASGNNATATTPTGANLAYAHVRRRIYTRRYCAVPHHAWRPDHD